DEGERGSNGCTRCARIDGTGSQVPRVVEERKKQVEKELAVGVASDVASQELRKRFGDAIADRAVSVDGPGVRKEPLPITKWVRVFGAKVAHGSSANVPDEHVGPKVLCERRYVDLGALVDRAPA